MKRVTGIGGVFFKCNDTEKVREWYAKHLGFNTDQYGTNFEWRSTDNPEQKRFTLWSPFKSSSDYFAPSTKDFMINFQVENLVKLLEELKAEGVEQVGELMEYEYGKFAHVMDPEGNKVELWEPVNDEYDKMIGKSRTF
jgi:predicted enzyme related to lactoylglutathione lyase